MDTDTSDSMILDPFSDDTCEMYMPEEKCPIFDQMKWRIVLRAPDDAKSFRFKYVFFSAEYDDYISAENNDKFYAVLEAESTRNKTPTVINFTECREPETRYDFICGAEHNNCVPGQKYCYIAVNSALSECCWYPRNSVYASNSNSPPCPDGFASTSIKGTNYECAANLAQESASMNRAPGSSTGWLETIWPIEGGETFTLTFQIHDTADGSYDSEVILDAFEFMSTSGQGTTGVVVK
ncbi:MAG: hypothetical protein GY847_39455, partial [Proteobacteria bacterium]|nr:hypothetical protein [Pseudomonadota bacterium]